MFISIYNDTKENKKFIFFSIIKENEYRRNS